MKFACVCQSGLGTSFMVQMNIQSLLEESGVNIDKFELEHMDVGSATPNAADYFFVEATLVSALPNIPREKIMSLQSIIDKEVAREALYKVLDENNISHQ
ncbi:MULTISPECIES: PTS sugar transporter subunit IIB [Lactococcus]|uniref:PTS sugar transporter subunit IIB n=1 Tax=Lactococcus TaxID=1357 RepID=UPI001CDC7649|nr:MULTISPECIES: PTS sugar transporter subunit IIB [Lactococcus]MCA2389839.1 PTS sugar transporter subunit IIB [Lactococcus sp. NH2-7C]MCT1195174.1 PTS sugar transporter subunit IIB [Lactococcus lactis]WGV30990.1 PTS sugar transporter subunit IIB [Lactococcus sp. NH2-7C]